MENWSVEAAGIYIEGKENEFTSTPEKAPIGINQERNCIYRIEQLNDMSCAYGSLNTADMSLLFREKLTQKNIQFKFWHLNIFDSFSKNCAFSNKTWH